VYTQKAAQEGALEAQTATEGFHTLQLTGANMPAANASPKYNLSVSYTAPQRLAQVAPPALDAAVVGRWAPVFSLPNVPIHAHVLPNGKMLFWGRRDRPTDTLDEHVCTPQVWDPLTGAVTPTPKPALANGTTVNLFCSGHTFLDDGRLLVTGGHLEDGVGVNQACLYDYRTNTWTATGLMNLGRWYPTAVTLADGTALVSSGSVRVNGQTGPNDVQQIWNKGTGTWQSIVNFVGLPLFPRMHLAPNGRVFMSGPLAQTCLLQTSDPTGWTPVGARAGGFRDYAPSVAYDEGKILFIGGGSDDATDQPSAGAEVIDLEAANPTWRPTADMHFPRRQHNATILPDGTVLVTGGSRHAGFNNLGPGQPVHLAELWNPATETWVTLASEDVDRCYHSVAVLLPDATVLSGGGGEYRPDGSLNQNDPKDSHRDAQIFSPPYLFKGPRPRIDAAPASVNYDAEFDVTTAQAGSIGRVSWIRLPSVTHSFDQNQRINFLKFKVGGGKVTVTAPANADLCPPGHYMLFILDTAGVPSAERLVTTTIPASCVGQPAFERKPGRTNRTPGLSKLLRLLVMTGIR
jgi:galactose oxidase